MQKNIFTKIINKATTNAKNARGILISVKKKTFCPMSCISSYTDKNVRLFGQLPIDK